MTSTERKARHRIEMAHRRARQLGRISDIRWRGKVIKAGPNGRPYLRIDGFLPGIKIVSVPGRHQAPLVTAHDYRVRY